MGNGEWATPALAAEPITLSEQERKLQAQVRLRRVQTTANPRPNAHERNTYNKDEPAEVFVLLRYSLVCLRLARAPHVLEAVEAHL
jgi:hypothetical protein